MTKKKISPQLFSTDRSVICRLNIVHQNYRNKHRHLSTFLGPFFLSEKTAGLNTPHRWISPLSLAPTPNVKRGSKTDENFLLFLHVAKSLPMFTYRQFSCVGALSQECLTYISRQYWLCILTLNPLIPPFKRCLPILASMVGCHQKSHRKALQTPNSLSDIYGILQWCTVYNCFSKTKLYKSKLTERYLSKQILSCIS